MNIQETAKAINEIKGVTGTKIWDRVSGKERIYIDTKKLNGGKNWNGGKGYTKCYLDCNTYEIVMEGEAGAATRNWHDSNDTLRLIAAAVVE
jgi:hypothetical protein